MNINRSVLVIVAASLAACGSGGGGNQFDDFISRIDAAGGLEYPNAEGVDPVDLPDSAEMSGNVVLASEEDDNLVIGDATATFDFAGGQIDGTADNFAEFDPNDGCDLRASPSACTADQVGELVGELAIDGAVGGDSFAFGLTGDLSGGADGDAFVASVDIDGTGDILELDGDLVAVGFGDGDINVDFDDPGIPDEEIEVLGGIFLQE